MQTITTFDSTKEALIDMLQSIKSAKTQLPDFQRGWIWDDEHIKSLLASISLSYPIGAVMMLQTGNAEVRFKPRLIEGLIMDNPPEPYAADNFNLRDDWDARSKQFRRHKILASVQSDDFLQAVRLLSTYSRRSQSIANGIVPENAPGISCKRKEILKLELEDYQKWTDAVTEGFISAARLLHTQKIFEARDLPYRTQLTPLAAIMALLGEKAENDGVRSKLARWYWCGVFGELYGGAIETRFARDLPEVLVWIEGGTEPATVTDANFVPSRLLTLRTRNSAAYKGIYALLMRNGGQDFRTGDSIGIQVYFDDRIDIHHIFPQAWCRKQAIEVGVFNSVINKAPISAKTNRMISNNPPSVYLERIQRNAGISKERMNDILRSHLIDPAPLRADDFAGFFSHRQATLLEGIEQAMGKSIVRETSDIVTIMGDDEYSENEEENEETEE